MSGKLNPADDRRDLLERHGEHVVQQEGEAFRRRQPVEHDEQREPDRIREERFLLEAAPARAGRDRLRRLRGEQTVKNKLPLELTSTRQFKNGNVVLTYER